MKNTFLKKEKINPVTSEGSGDKRVLLVINLLLIFFVAFFLFPLDVYDKYNDLLIRGISIFVYSIIALIFTRIYLANYIRVWIYTLIFTGLGIVARYFLFTGMMDYAPEYVAGIAVTYIIINSLLLLMIYYIVGNYKLRNKDYEMRKDQN